VSCGQPLETPAGGFTRGASRVSTI
jgi:hypothetical protein